MGPLPFSSGNSDCRAVVIAATTASMGPLPFSSGNQQTADTAQAEARRFNGATAFQQWKLCPRASA